MRKKIALMILSFFIGLSGADVFAIPSAVIHSPAAAPTTKANGSGSTIIVASSDTSAKGKASADYVCAGTNCGVMINTAINALAPTGGKVVLLEGTYEIDPLTPVGDSNKDIILEGQGNSTLLKAKAGAAGTLISATHAGRFIIRNLRVDGNKASSASVICLATDSATGDGSISNVTVENCNRESIRVGGNFQIRGSFLNNNDCGIRTFNVNNSPRPVTQVNDIINDSTGAGVSSSCSNDLWVFGIVASVRNNILKNTASSPTFLGPYASNYGYNDPRFTMHLIENNIVTGNGFYNYIQSGTSGFSKSLYSSNVVSNSVTSGIRGGSSWGIAAIGNIITGVSSSASGIDDNPSGGVYNDGTGPDTKFGSLFQANMVVNNAGTGYSRSLSISPTLFSNSVIADNNRHGMYLANADTSSGTTKNGKSLIAIGNVVANNSTSLDGGYSNINIDSTYNPAVYFFSRYHLQGNTIRTGTNANKPKYGLYTATGYGLTFQNVITNNDIQAARTGVLFENAAGSNVYNWAGSTTTPGNNVVR